MFKAFDNIPHNVLVKKLSDLSIANDNCLPTGFLLWIQSYLCSRTQRVRLKNILSDTCDILSGVPQGSLLGPLLFSIFMSDLNSVNLKIPASVIKYADDTAIICRITDDLNFTTNCFTTIVNWCDDNLLKLNCSKSKELIICKRNVDRESITYVVEGVDEIRYLGVILNCHFNWNSHVDNICSIASKNFTVFAYSNLFCPRII